GRPCQPSCHGLQARHRKRRREFSTGSLKPMRLALAQINTTVGDLDGNREKIIQGLDEARSAAADLVLFPELDVTGYPPDDLALAGAQLLTNLTASPFHIHRDREREVMFATRARDNACFVAFCNAVGGQDELIFDGHSLVLDEDGRVLARAPGFEEALLVVDIEPAEAIGRRLRDLRRRALARERGTPPAATRVH